MNSEQHSPPARLAWAGRNYRVQTAATVVSGLGNAAAPIATAFAVMNHGGGTAEVGYVTAARWVPLVLLLLVGGALADRLPRNLVMVGANVFNALSQAALAALILCGRTDLWALMLLSAAGGAGHAFFAPASEGVILESVTPEHATRAFSVYRMAANGAQIGGAALGGALTGLIGPGWVLALDALCFAVAAGLRVLLRLEPPAESARKAGMVAELRSGWREFLTHRWLWAIVLQFGVINACTTAVEAVYGPMVAKERLGGAGAWGLAMAALSVGMVSTGVLMARWQPRRLLLAGNCGVFLFAVPSFALALGLPAAAIDAAMFLSGAGVTVFGVCWMVALQQEIPAGMFSRVAAYDSFGSFALLPLGSGLAGPVSELLGMKGALWSCSVVTLALSAAVLVIPEVRRLARRTAVAPAAAPVAAPGPLAVAEADVVTSG